MAQLFERSHALDLAEFIYRKMNAYYEVASCLLQTGTLKSLSFYVIELFSIRFIETMFGLSHICC
jgi:hypothetical protein